MPVCHDCKVVFRSERMHVCPGDRRSPWASLAITGFALFFPVVSAFAMTVLVETEWRYRYPSEEWFITAAVLASVLGLLPLARRWPRYWIVIALGYIPFMVIASLIVMAAVGVSISCSQGDCL
jgi:formate-dependent nitrite reductase membrane component NrfD